MTEQCARAILRLIAIVTVMAGLTLVIFTFINHLSASRAVGGLFNGMLSQISAYSLLGNLAVSGVGLALFALSSKLAVLVVE